MRPAADTGSDSTAVLLRVLTADDTIKTPLASPYLPNASRSARTKTEWNRDELFAAGALTLGELVAQVPGATLMTTGFLMAPQVVAWHGDPAAVRLFVDGIEREDVTPRNAGVSDLALFPLWALEQVSFEITPGELRVHARTWRVDRTSPYTRTDVLTGSENLNLFRGYFGKRSTTGVAVQLAAQQASTASVRGLDGEGLGAMARLGWARGEWSVDATMIRQASIATRASAFRRRRRWRMRSHHSMGHRRCRTCARHGVAHRATAPGCRSSRRHLARPRRVPLRRQRMARSLCRPIRQTRRRHVRSIRLPEA